MQAVIERAYRSVFLAKGGSSCGANADGGGGFQPGNTCGGGDGDDGVSAGEKKSGAKSVHGQIRGEGGFTYHITSDTTPKTGYALSILPGNEQAFDSVDDVTVDVLEDYFEKAFELSKDNPNILVGCWWNSGGFDGNDEPDERVYLDTPIVVQNLEEAHALARKHGQLGMYDLKNKRTIQTMTAEERSDWEKKNGRIGKSYAAQTWRNTGGTPHSRPQLVRKSQGPAGDSGRDGSPGRKAEKAVWQNRRESLTLEQAYNAVFGKDGSDCWAGAKPDPLSEGDDE